MPDGWKPGEHFRSGPLDACEPADLSVRLGTLECHDSDVDSGANQGRDLEELSPLSALAETIGRLVAEPENAARRGSHHATVAPITSAETCCSSGPPTMRRVSTSPGVRRIALVSSSFAPYVGGVEEHVRRVAAELAELGHSVEVWTVDRGEQLGERSVDGVPVRYLPSPLPARSPKAVVSYAAESPSAWRRWVRAHRQFKPDVLHVQCFGPNGLYALALHRRFGTPLMVSSHGETFMDDHHVFDESALLRAGLRRALVRASVVTGCSQYVIDDLKGRFGLRGGTVVPNGVDVNVRPSPECGPAPYVFAVGRLGYPKGFDLLLAAYAKSTLPEDGVRLVIGGDGSERSALEEQRTALALDSLVDIPGRLSPEQVAGGMAGATAVIVPSRIEAFGIVALEAWRSGTALIMTSRGGGPELIRDGVDGILVDPRDTTALSRALDRLHGDPNLRRQLGSAGRLRVGAFTWAATAAAYDQLYRSIHETPKDIR